MSLPPHSQPRPPGWRPLKYFCAEPPQYGLNVSSSEYTDHPSGGLRLLRTTDINEDGSLISGAEVYINAGDASTKYRLTPGDLLLSRSGTLGRSFLCTTSSPPSTFAGYLIRFRPRLNIDPRYLSYCSRATFFEDGIKANAVASTIANFNAERYGSLQLPWHPLPEQRAIADYLDTETARIDTLISKKRRLIDLLTEKRTALITQTVTRGLDPSPRLRPSGITWLLGDIPEHWKLLRLGRMGSFFKGGGGTKQDETEEGVPCVRYGDLYTHHQFFIRDTRASIAEATTSNYRPLRYGDVLFAGSGETIDEIGTSAVNLIKGRAFCGGDVIVFRPSVEVHANFLGYATDCQSAVYQKACMGRGVTVMHIYSNALKDLLIPVPPIEEQRAIADYLDAETARIDALSSRQESVITLLEERRTALITAAVTGQISMSVGQ